VISIVGPRPNFVKLAPISWILKHSIIHTGQHYDYEMSRIFFDELNIPEPNHYLSISGGSDGQQISRMILAIYDLIREMKPKIVIVYGDSNTTVAGAIASNKAEVVVAHVESGLRNNDRSFPEEVNRLATEVCSDLLFCPTLTAFRTVENTGRAYLTGDLTYDTLKSVKNFDDNLHHKYGASKPYVLMTLHRRRNVDNISTYGAILKTMGQIGYDVLYPVHPRAKLNLRRVDIPQNVITIPPVGYIPFLSLLKNAKRVFTDSGGVQKEAYLLGTPCSTFLSSTPWVETLSGNWNLLVGVLPEQVLASMDSVPSGENNPGVFGDGLAARKIIKKIMNSLS